MTKSNTLAIQQMLNFAQAGLMADDAERNIAALNHGDSRLSISMNGIGVHLVDATLMLSGAYSSGAATELAMPLIAVASRMFKRDQAQAHIALNVCTQVLRTAPGYSPPVDAALGLMVRVGISSLGCSEHERAASVFNEVGRRSLADTPNHHEAMRGLVWLRMDEERWSNIHDKALIREANQTLGAYGVNGSPEQVYGQELSLKGDNAKIARLHVNDVDAAYKARTKDRDERQAMVDKFMATLKA